MSKGFYIHIDAILDTRAGTVRRLNPEAHAVMVKNGYHQRKGDFFEGVKYEDYRALYESHDVDTLIESTMTNVFQFLYPQVLDSVKELVAAEAQAHQRPTVDVNVWPYALQDDEMAMLRTLIYQQMRGVVGVNIFSKDIAELTPAKCAENYNMMIMYDYDKYLNTHASALIRDPKPFLILIAPMVFFNRNPDTDEETLDMLKQGINSLALLEATIAPRICLKFVNVEIFSIVYPDDRILKVDAIAADHSITIEELDKKLEAQRAREKRIPEA